ENASIYIENQTSRGRLSPITSIGCRGIVDSNRAWPALRNRQLAPFRQAFADRLSHHLRIGMITVGQQLAGGRETINALAGRSAFPFLRPLVRDLAKESALGILAAALIPVVAGHRYILLPSHANDFRIGES